jgi:methionine-rich copper-binding protein CopC
MRRVVAFLAVFLISAAMVLAHATLVRSEPKSGAVLKEPPQEVRMWFTERIKALLSTIEVRDSAGKEVDRRDLQPDAKEPGLVHLSLARDLGPGTYKVTWSAVAQDMHVSKGSFSFQVAPK